MRSPKCQMDQNNLARVFGPTIVGHGTSEPSPTTIMRDTNTQPKVSSSLSRTPPEPHLNMRSKMQQTAEHMEKLLKVCLSVCLLSGCRSSVVHPWSLLETSPWHPDWPDLVQSDLQPWRRTRCVLCLSLYSLWLHVVIVCLVVCAFLILNWSISSRWSIPVAVWYLLSSLWREPTELHQSHWVCVHVGSSVGVNV